jgi:transketolase
MRAQPGMAVVTPAASGQVAAVVRAIQELPGPAYLRVSKQTISIPALDGVFELGRAEQLVDGDDVAIIAMGGMAEFALGASQLLADRGVSASVTAVSSVAPAPEEDLVALVSRVPLALTVEAHYITGGLGSLVAETIAEHGIDCRLVRAGVRALPLGISGGREYMHHQLGLSAERLAEVATQALTVGQS